MKNKLISICLMIMLIFSVLVLTACNSKEEESTESESVKKELKIDEDDFEDPAYYNEDDGAEPITEAHDEEDFYGRWEGTSERVKYLFGNVNLKINEDGTWKGNVSETPLHGKWHYDGKQIIIKDTEGLVNWRLYYATDGTLLFEDLEDKGMSFVLKKVK
jgi:hypothetical protein